jgi:hypothetical protein
MPGSSCRGELALAPYPFVAKTGTFRSEWAPLGPELGPLEPEWVSSGDGMDTGTVPALESLSTILPGN